MRRLVVLVAMLMLSVQADAAPRSAAARQVFAEAHHFPATGKVGKCPSYVVDHIVPLRA